MSTNAENKSGFNTRTFTDTVTVGGMAAKGLQESLAQKQKLLALFGQLAGSAASLMDDVLTAVATAAQANVNMQAKSFQAENQAALAGALVSGGSAMLMEGIGFGVGRSTMKPADMLENEATNCEKAASYLEQPVEEPTLNAQNVTEAKVAEDENTTTTKKAKVTTKQTEEENHKAVDKMLKDMEPKTRKAPVSTGTKKDAGEFREKVKNVVGKKTIIEDGKTKTVDAREYYKDQFTKKAKEYREEAQQVRMEASKKSSEWAQRATMYSMPLGQATSASLNLGNTYQYKSDQQYTAAAEARNSAMSSMASSLQGTVTSSIADAAKEATQQAQTITQAQTSK